MSTTYRKRCLREKGRECLVCESTDSLVVHHVDGDRSNNSLDNLIPVCRSCHGRIHSKHDGYGKWYQKLREDARWHGDSAKEDYQGMQFFLPPDLRQEFDIVATELDTQRRRRNGNRVEKIRHFDPLIITLGLEAVADADPDELEERLVELDA